MDIDIDLLRDTIEGKANWQRCPNNCNQGKIFFNANGIRTDNPNDESQECGVCYGIGYIYRSVG